MKAFLDHIRTKIAADLPEIKTVRKYREQYIAANKDLNDTPFRYPAIFVEFVPTEYFNYQQYLDVALIVRFHVGVENYMIEKDEDMELIDRIDRAFKGWRGNSIDLVNFTTFEKIIETDDPADDNVNIQIVEFKTTYREIDSVDADFVTVKPVDIELDAEILKPQSIGISFNASKGEYLISPATVYFQPDPKDLYLSFDYDGYDGSDVSLLGTQNGAFTYVRVAMDKNSITFKNSLSGNKDEITALLNTPSSGKIEIKGNGPNIEMYLDRKLIGSVASTVIDYTFFNGNSLYFNSQDGSSIGRGYITIKELQIQADIWNYTEGEGDKTFSLLGKETNIISTGDTNEMWIIK